MGSEAPNPEIPDPATANPKNWWVIIPATLLGLATLLGAITTLVKSCGNSSTHSESQVPTGQPASRPIPAPPTCAIADTPFFSIEHTGVTNPLLEGFQSGKPDVDEATQKKWNTIKLKAYRDGQSWFISNPLLGPNPYVGPIKIDLAEVKRWRMTLKAEVISTRPYGGIFASLDTGLHRFDLNVIPAYRNDKTLKARWNTGINSPTEISGVETAPFNNGHSFHTYELTYDPASKLATLCVDGEVMRHDNYQGHVDYIGGHPRFVWGASGADASFALARFEAFK